MSAAATGCSVTAKGTGEAVGDSPTPLIITCSERSKRLASVSGGVSGVRAGAVGCVRICRALPTQTSCVSESCDARRLSVDEAAVGVYGWLNMPAIQDLYSRAHIGRVPM